VSCAFGRYYTSDILSSILIDHIDIVNPKTIVDFGAGEGALLYSAIKKWENSSFIAIDINTNGCKQLKKKFPSINVYNQDVLQYELLDNISLKEEVDIAICNPPYINSKIEEFHKDILKSADLEELIKLKNISADILFLAQNLRVLKTGGELGIILPDTLLTSHNYKLFREILLKKHQIKKIFQLPEKGFLKTEAQTYILILKKGLKSNKEIPIYNVFSNGQISNPIYINTNNLIERMDYTYFQWKQQNLNKQYLTLKDINADIKRGSLNNTYCKQNNINIFHTSHFDIKKKTINFKNSQVIANKLTAKTGDILLARVGKRNIGKVVKVTGGINLVSDCILKITVEKKYQKAVFNSLNSKSGQSWLKAHSHGVCAKVISKRDLLNFPIYL